METYTGKINEFVDWVTGIDSLSETNVTNNLPVSGGSIRQLLQDRLKTPFVTYEDKNAGLFRLFSSEDAQQQWINMTNPESVAYDPDEASKLELFSFVRPGDTALVITGLTSDPRYIILGDDGTSSDSQAIVSFWVNLQKEEAGNIKQEYDSFIVTYTITDSNGSVSTISESYGSSYCNHAGDPDTAIVKNIYPYLTEGTNSVQVSVKAQNSSATNNIEFTVSLVTFELQSSFDYATAKRYGDQILVPVSINRSISNLNLNVKISVLDGSGQSSIFETVTDWETSSTEKNITREFRIDNHYAANQTSADHIKHTIKIEAQMQNGNNTFRSNVLFYNFETSASTESINAGIANKFINIAYNTPANKLEQDVNTGDVILQAQQYSPFILNWAYYTDQTNEQSIDVQWALETFVDDHYEYQQIQTIIGAKDQKSEALVFIPSDEITLEDSVYLAAIYNNRVIDKFPIIVQKSNFDIRETSGMAFKINAYGKSNNSADARIWVDSVSGAQTDFSFNTFDDSTGWNNNSLVLSGENNYAIVDYCPFQNSVQTYGKTIEFEFKAENVNNDSDVILRIGSAEKGHIDVTPNSAGLYVAQTLVVQTNFKANERIKLAFIFNPSTVSSDPSSNLVFIVNNGILERAANADVYTYEDVLGRIKIGGSNSGIRLYNMRIYNRAISYEQALDNYIYDTENKAPIISRNEITKDSKIDYDLTKSKIDTILLEGDLDPIMTKFNGKSECTANISRSCITDPTKDFTANNVRIRKHGQSTLNYPIVSLKVWLNKSNADGGNPELRLSAVQQAMNLSKNRYIMKNGSIPANKFVLQANYADSSGVHNGGLERLINDTWYNAVIDGEYKLRTAPQLFTTNEIVHHNNENLGEGGSAAWVEGYGSDKGEGRQWKDITGKDFPYQIRTAPDSFACAVFYRNTGSLGDGNIHFLGQYVFMDDKKSDYTFGERSIYSFGNNTDPFVMNIDNTKNGKNGKQDTKENRVWSNSDVLRVEVVLPNYELTSYMDFNVAANYTIDEQGNVQTGAGTTVPCTDIKVDGNNKQVGYYWEDFFDLIYPDPDDLEEEAGVTKFDENSEFNKTTKPFIDWLRWITSIGQLRKTNPSAAQQKFQQEAHDHLDVYKLAAYYIFYLRFGLVDSVERNAQLKTYDGQHWHYEPWDMDIALGNTNQGMLVFMPPMNRDSLIPGTQIYAYSGRSASTSNVLWDCLEAWEYWSDTIVPKVANALYKAGLSYTAVSKLFDDEYVNKWSETIYNDSGYFKYIENGGSEWLAWLQGARTSHRHWWLSTSMNYYDAKWSCGEFNEHRIALFADKAKSATGTDLVTIKPTSDTFFKFTQNDGTAVIDTIQCSRLHPAVFDVSDKIFSAKDPAHIYGSTFVEEIDVSCLAKSLNSINLSSCYDNVLGAPVKVVNVGIPYISETATHREGYTSGTKFSLIGSSGGKDALENMVTLNVTGQSNINGGLSGLIDGRKNIQNIYALGTDITAFANNPEGNKFVNVELPSATILTNGGVVQSTNYLNTIELRNASWENLTFWSTQKSSSQEYIYDEHGEIERDEEGNAIFAPNIATFEKTTIPAQLQTMKFTGSTATNACAGRLLLDWIDAIEAEVARVNPSYTEQDVYDAISTKTFEAKNINWGAEEDGPSRVNISYNTLARIAKFNRGMNQNGTLSGYIRISDQQNLTVTQLSNLRNWFGETVFDLSAKNSRLVIDQNREYVQISAGNVVTDGNELYLSEPNAAVLSANKFMLGSDETEYTWYLSTRNDSIVAPQFARIVKGDDGVTRLITSESTNGNYSVYIKVGYTFNDQYIESENVKINILAVTYPADWVWEVSNTARQFKQTNDIARNIFGAGNYMKNNTLIDTYILYRPNLDAWFKIKPSSVSFTATINSISYKIAGISNLSAQYPNLAQTDDIDEYLSASVENGIISIHTKAVPSDNVTYQLEAIVKVGGTEIHRYINLLLVDDNIPVLFASQSDLFAVVSNKYATDYGLAGAYFDFYKSHLLSLTGTIDFSSHPSIPSLITDTNQSIFKYLYNITGIIMDGCTNIGLTNNSISGSDKRVFVFEDIAHLVTLTIKNNYNAYGTLDLSSCSDLTNIDLRDTYTGVILPERSKVTSLKLGTPPEVQMNRPLLLTAANTSIQSSAELSNVVLNYVNNNESVGFNMFNVLYN